MKAFLSNYRQSPRKVRLVADAVVGKGAPEALRILAVMVKRSATPLHKLLASAVANAKQNEGVAAENLVVKRFTVEAGPTMKRIMPRARGSAAQILKRTSRVFVELAASAISEKAITRKLKVKGAEKKLS